MGKHIKFAHVNENGDFEKVLQHFEYEYTRSGIQLRIRCPFHDDSSPSGSINVEETTSRDGKIVKKNTLHCFGCDKAYTLIDFVATIMPEPEEDDDYHESEDDEFGIRRAAIKIDRITGCGLAPRKGSRRKKTRTNEPKEAEKKSSDSQRTRQRRRVSNGAAKAATNGTGAERAAPAAREAKSEPSKRVINPPLKFTLQLDHEHEYVRERLTEGEIAEFGVGVLPDTSRSRMFAGRCCVPLHNTAAELIGYMGRYFGDDPKEPKWKLPKDFDKMCMLYNAHRVRGVQHLVLVEGPFDVIKLHSIGIPSVACIGTAVSAEQVALLTELGARRITVLFDGDDEGQAAAEQVVPMLARSFFVRLGSLPVGIDPAEAERSVLVEAAGAIW